MDEDNYANGIKKITPELMDSGDDIAVGKGFSLVFSEKESSEGETEYCAEFVRDGDKVDGREISAKELQDYYFGNKNKMKVEMAQSLVTSNSFAIFDAEDTENEDNDGEK